MLLCLCFYADLPHSQRWMLQRSLSTEVVFLIYGNVGLDQVSLWRSWFMTACQVLSAQHGRILNKSSQWVQPKLWLRQVGPMNLFALQCPRTFHHQWNPGHVVSVGQSSYRPTFAFLNAGRKFTTVSSEALPTSQNSNELRFISIHVITSRIQGVVDSATCKSPLLNAWRLKKWFQWNQRQKIEGSRIAAYLHSLHLSHQASESLLNLMARNSFCGRFFHVHLMLHEYRCRRSAKFAQVAKLEIVESDVNVFSRQRVCRTPQKHVHQRIHLSVGPFFVGIFRLPFYAVPSIMWIYFRGCAQLRRLRIARNFVALHGYHIEIFGLQFLFVITSRRAQQHRVMIAIKNRTHGDQHHHRNKMRAAVSAPCW